ncbi:hypothetical protein [Piscirickettsia salmonis]|uniref:hypothetical protein n=1 Tax=Piscirickettsia salmonis TaxID=1238 RepID=UPI003A80A429
MKNKALSIIVKSEQLYKIVDTSYVNDRVLLKIDTIIGDLPYDILDINRMESVDLIAALDYVKLMDRTPSLKDCILSNLQSINDFMKKFIEDKYSEKVTFNQIEKSFKKINIIKTSKKDIIQILDQKRDPSLPYDTSTLIADHVMKELEEPVALNEGQEDRCTIL